MKASNVCEEMTQEEFLQMIEKSPILKKRLEEIGVTKKDAGLQVLLNYSDLLSKQEEQELRKVFPDFMDDDELFPKFGKDPILYHVCYSDEICERCYQGLLEYRAKKLG